jgi:hypothetical protein
VSPDAKKPDSLVCNLKLTSGKARTGMVVGPDDQLLQGVHAAGLVVGGKPEAMKSAEFTLTGLGDRKRILVFFHPEKKLGSVVVVRGDSEVPIRVKLEALGTVTGTVLDSEGKPWAGLKITLRPETPPREYDNLPHEWTQFQGVFGGQRGLWPKFLGREAVTDKDGRFRLEGVLPDVGFVVYASDGDLAKERTLAASRSRVRVEAGKTQDLGVLKQGEGVKRD